MEAQTEERRQSPDQPRSTWRAGFRSLQFKASLLVILAVVAVATVGVAVSTQMAGVLLYDNEFTRTQEWANTLAAGTSAAVEASDRESLTHTVNDVTQTRAVAYAAFANASGEVLASSQEAAGLLDSSMMPDGKTLRLEPLHTPQLVWHESLNLACASVAVPVYSTTPLRRTGPTSRPIVGYLHFATDVTETRAKLEEFKDYLSRIGIGLSLLAVPCSLLVTRHVVAPLNELANMSRAIADGSTEVRANVRAKNEIGDLAESFNTMANRLTRSQQELLRLNADLENRVQARTRELEELASRDSLTGLYNRRHFAEVMAREFAAAERYDADLTCLMFDLDYFKQINDQFGHRAGDEILIMIAQAIDSELRGSDVAARFGGDEFIVLLPQTSAPAASMLVERIVSRFRDNFARKLPGVPGDVSVGVASLRTTQAPTTEALIHEADLLLYAAKEERRHRAAAAPPYGVATTPASS